MSHMSEQGDETPSTARSWAQSLVPRAQKAAPQAATGFFRTVLTTAIDGRGRFLGAAAIADKLLKSSDEDVQRALSEIIDQHVRLAGAQGFVTSLGGFAVIPVAIPANITGLAILQTRMVAAIAHLRGYDIDDSRVRLAIMTCLLGEEKVRTLVSRNRVASTPLAIATAPMHDPDLESKLATEVTTAMATRVGGRRLSLVVSRRIPLIGGGVGAVADGVSTHRIGRYAQREFPSRR